MLWSGPEEIVKNKKKAEDFISQFLNILQEAQQDFSEKEIQSVVKLKVKEYKLSSRYHKQVL